MIGRRRAQALDPVSIVLLRDLASVLLRMGLVQVQFSQIPAAIAWTCVGDANRAFDWLDRAYAAHTFTVAHPWLTRSRSWSDFVPEKLRSGPWPTPAAHGSR